MNPIDDDGQDGHRQNGASGPPPEGSPQDSRPDDRDELQLASLLGLTARDSAPPDRVFRRRLRAESAAAFLAHAASYRHVNLDTDIHPQIGILVSSRMLDRARILGAAMRVAYIISAAMPDILARAPMRCGKTELTLALPPDLAALGSEKLQSRLRQLARLIGREPRIVV